MKTVKYEDSNGKKHVVSLPDDVPDAKAERGIPILMPDVTELDWEAIGIELHNLLVERGLFSLDDVSKTPNILVNSIVSVVKPRVVTLYKTLKES